MIEEKYITIATEIVFDEDKVKREEIYSLDKMKRRLDDIFVNGGLNVQIPGRLYTNERFRKHDDYYTDLWGTIGYLVGCKWFVENVKEWWYYPEGTNPIKEPKGKKTIHKNDLLKSYYEVNPNRHKRYFEE